MKGFTLVELLVSIAIIGILAATAIGLHQEFRRKAYDAVSQQIVHDISTAIEAWISTDWDKETAEYATWAHWADNTNQYWGNGEDFSKFYPLKDIHEDFYFLARLDTACLLGEPCTNSLVSMSCAAHCPSSEGATVRRYCRIEYQDGRVVTEFNSPTKSFVKCS